MMKFKIAYVLLLSVAAQTQFIGGYPGYPLLPATSSVQWLSQPVPSVFTHVYPNHAVNYRDVVGNVVAPWFYYNPNSLKNGQPFTADVKDVNAPAASTRTKRQILLRYRSTGGRRNGRSLNDPMPVFTAYNEFSAQNAAKPRAQRQIQLVYRSTGGRRNGRSLNEPKSVFTAYNEFTAQNAAKPRAQRQILLRYRNSAASRRRNGRSLNEPFTTA